ncbi:hypothetical protein [Streptomyces sp. UNOC14_S4]|uniref:hypothetical protein n=1 Tax=Streptomyces sp. UNOC14_S4 TaxID=2872340 RepID=UPI001E565576|nr:hypothetical protein [Streptomyces sp. UNOC14_S4]MCC3768378.1 hypothetical protein [Streptomyces sp. UNOC14_S4]
MTDGINAGKDALDNITKGLNGVIDELKKSGGSPGEAAVGRGFGELALSGLETGDQSLADTFKSFCHRWEWGVRALVRDGSQFAQRVGLAAGYYHEGDTYISNTFKVTTNALMGNPHLTEEQVEQQSWGQTLSDNPFNQIAHADYSGKSFEQAARHTEETAKRTAEDLKK